jgi:hypothetical protein
MNWVEVVPKIKAEQSKVRVGNWITQEKEKENKNKEKRRKSSIVGPGAHAWFV